MLRKISIGLLSATFFAVLVGAGIAAASQSFPENRLTLVLGEACRPVNADCQTHRQCCSGKCVSQSFLPWVPGQCRD